EQGHADSHPYRQHDSSCHLLWGVTSSRGRVSGGRRPHEGEPQTWTGESRPSVRETDSHNDGLVTNPQRREVRGCGGSSYADDYTYWHAYRGRVTGPELVIFFPEKWSGSERSGEGAQNRHHSGIAPFRWFEVLPLQLVDRSLSR